MNKKFNSIIDFLETKQDKEKLKIALNIIRDFKGYESREEWIATPFIAWSKLEQLEEFLDHLVNGTELKEDTNRFIRYMESINE